METEHALLVKSDIQNKYWFPHGQTPMGNSDWVRPLALVNSGVHIKTGNVGDTVIVPIHEYLEIRKHPHIKTGLWQFSRLDEPIEEITYCTKYPIAAGHELAALRKQYDALIAEPNKEQPNDKA